MKQNKSEEFAIVVFSCDKNEEVWPVFHHCLEKYWKNHPKTYLLTETKKYKEIETITINVKIDYWSKRMRESLQMIPYQKILFICDDCFLNKPVNKTKLKKGLELLDRDNTASVNMEIIDDYTDIDCGVEGFKKKLYHSPNYLVNFLCGLWNKDKLINLLSDKDCTPWVLEYEQKCKNFYYYQTVGDKVISWFRDTPGTGSAIRFGKWSLEAKDFAKKEKIKIDFSKKGFWSPDYWNQFKRISIMMDKTKSIIEEEEKIIKQATKIKNDNQTILEELYNQLSDLDKKEEEFYKTTIKKKKE